MKKFKISLIVLSLIAYACGGADESQEIPVDTTTSTSTTVLVSEPDIGEVYDESELVFLQFVKAIIGATGVLTGVSEDWEVLAITPLEMGVKIRLEMMLQLKCLLKMVRLC